MFEISIMEEFILWFEIDYFLDDEVEILKFSYLLVYGYVLIRELIWVNCFLKKLYMSVVVLVIVWIIKFLFVGLMLLYEMNNKGFEVFGDFVERLEFCKWVVRL